jgi:hypothetical protein
LGNFAGVAGKIKRLKWQRQRAEAALALLVEETVDYLLIRKN